MQDNTRLCHAALEGDVSYLQRILEEDPNISRRCMIQNSGSFMQSPLHIASKNGHLQFINVILQHPAQLAKDIFQPYGCLSPLHLASEMGQLEIVKALVEANPNMCLTEDEHGRNPIHIAAMMGNVEVFEELVRVNPQAARKRANGGETYLHLCIQYGQTQALTELLSLTEDVALLNATDSKGDTILHYAVHTKKFEMVKIVAEDKRIVKDVENKEGLTALGNQILLRLAWIPYKRRPLTGKKLNATFRKIFMPNMLIRWNDEDTIGPYLEDAYNQSAKYNKPTYFQTLLKKDEWLERNRNSVPVVASLIAAMSFQVGINPPGGTWQDSDFDHIPGGSIIGSTFSKANIPDFQSMIGLNTTALLSSLIVILIWLLSNFTSFRRRRRAYSNLVMSYYLLGYAVVSTILTYIYSISFLLRASITEYHFVTKSGVRYAISTVGCLSFFMFLAFIKVKLQMILRRHKLRSQITIPSTLP